MELKTESLIARQNDIFWARANIASKNPIAASVIASYGVTEKPSTKDVLKEGQRLAKLGYITKKGKKLTFLNGNNKDKYKDESSRSFVEDDVAKYKYYCTTNGTIMPVVGDENSGGRVVSSFTLIPSWIRDMITINGKKLAEVDFSCLHPNIASSVYGGTKKHINHQIVADYLNEDIKLAKIEHLSFFNKRWDDMTKSKLFKYYTENEPQMMENIFNDKKGDDLKNNKGEFLNRNHTNVSKNLFKVEVDIMTQVALELNRMEINAVYVYDAYYVEPEDLDIVTEIMNQAIKMFNINKSLRDEG